MIYNKITQKMYKEINIEHWPRKEAYLHFKNFTNPYFNICSNIDITNLYEKCKKRKYSLNLALHYLSLITVNEIKEFRLRELDGKVVLFDIVSGGATISMDDGSFRYCLYPFIRSFNEFTKLANDSENAVKESKISDSRVFGLDVIHYSVIPWISFTSITHARNSTTGETIPKITFGKYYTINNIVHLPISVEVNHSLIDGHYVGIFINKLQEYINNSLIDS